MLFPRGSRRAYGPGVREVTEDTPQDAESATWGWSRELGGLNLCRLRQTPAPQGTLIGPLPCPERRTAALGTTQVGAVLFPFFLFKGDSVMGIPTPWRPTGDCISPPFLAVSLGTARAPGEEPSYRYPHNIEVTESGGWEAGLLALGGAVHLRGRMLHPQAGPPNLTLGNFFSPHLRSFFHCF